MTLTVEMFLMSKYLRLMTAAEEAETHKQAKIVLKELKRLNKKRKKREKKRREQAMSQTG